MIKSLPSAVSVQYISARRKTRGCLIPIPDCSAGQNPRAMNWPGSVEEWLISPMITNNKDFWILRIIIPFKEYSRPEPG